MRQNVKRHKLMYLLLLLRYVLVRITLLLLTFLIFEKRWGKR